MNEIGPAVVCDPPLPTVMLVVWQYVTASDDSSVFSTGPVVELHDVSTITPSTANNNATRLFITMRTPFPGLHTK